MHAASNVLSNFDNIDQLMAKMSTYQGRQELASDVAKRASEYVGSCISVDSVELRHLSVFD
jgi:hypothetical protein